MLRTPAPGRALLLIVEVEIAEDRVDAEKDKLAAAKAAGEEEAEADKATMVSLLNERARRMEELETVLGRDLTALRNVKKPFPRISYTEAVEQVARLREAMTDEDDRALVLLPVREDGFHDGAGEVEGGERHDDHNLED